MGTPATHRPFQDEIAHNHCWGCGPANEHGLQIKSYWQGDEGVCTYQPLPHHMAGPTHVLNGGIIATLMDCHSACTAIAAAYQAEGRGMNTEPSIWYVTASMRITYLRPTPIGNPVTLRARVKKTRDRMSWLTCSLFSGGEERARGELLFVRVPDSWREAPA